MPFRKDQSIAYLAKNGASVEVYFYGATLSSWKSASVPGAGLRNAIERLWMSGAAILDGSAPIRGGIPIAFPIFAVDVHPDYPELGGAHGFARINIWTLDDDVVETDDKIVATFRLSSNTSIAALFPHPFALAYVVTLTSTTLTTAIHVVNPSSAESIAWRFNTLLHTYYKVPHSLKASISPLRGVQYIDRLDGMKKKLEEEDRVTLTSETARAYDLSKGSAASSVFLSYGADTKEGLKITTEGFEDAVYWNPREVAGGKVADMEKGGWDRFVCWEPGVICRFKTLNPGESFIGVQHLEAVNEE